jgi:hypothetical protein
MLLWSDYSLFWQSLEEESEDTKGATRIRTSNYGQIIVFSGKVWIYAQTIVCSGKV